MRWDSTTTQYDIGFRTYDPGLNQFLTRDMYNGALADTGLSTDPFTGNRYTFGAGNPVSNIELDGHMPCISGGPCGSFQGLARWSSAQQNASTVPVQISPHVDGNQGDPKAKALQAAWSWAVGQYGAATSPEREFTLWHDICTVSSYRSLCTGMLAIDFGNMPNFRVETAFGMGFKIMIAPAVVGGVRSLLDPASMVGVKLDELRAMLPKTWVARTLRQGSGWRFGTPASGSRPFGAQGWAEWNNGVPTSPDPLHQNEFVRLSSGGLQYRVAAGENPIIGNPDIPSAQVIQLGNPGPGLSGASDLNPAGPEVPPPPG